MLKAHLLVIDPQNDFADILAGPLDPVGLIPPDGTRFRSALPVPGTLEDMERVAKLVKRAGRRLDGIHITLDSHRVIDVAHPEFWRDRNGRKPPPFTLISQDNIQDGDWTPRNAQHRQRMLDYTGALQSAGKFMLMIWPEHCLIGGWGHNVIESLKSELDAWERSQNMDVNYVTKGTNAFTEHYGALMAEVPDPTDPSTQLNGELLSVLQGADIIGVAGEASSHCVMTTVEQIVNHIGDRHLTKIHILTDCMSPVPQTPGAPDFSAIAKNFLHNMQRRGLMMTTADAFLA